METEHTTTPLRAEDVLARWQQPDVRAGSPGLIAGDDAMQWRDSPVRANRGGLWNSEMRELTVLQAEPHVALWERLRRSAATPVLAAVLVAVVGIGAAAAVTMWSLGGSTGGPVGEPQTIDESSAATTRGDEGKAVQGARAANEKSLQGVEDPTSAPNTPMLIHVVGEVQSPGVVKVAAGGRVADAISAAGGATDAAVLDAVNLARQAVDGEQIIVPNAENADAIRAQIGETGGRAGTSGAVGTGAGASGGLVNVNTADAAALESLPRVGPALAQRILDWRAQHKSFTSVDQLLDVPGIGERTLEGLRGLVTL